MQVGGHSLIYIDFSLKVRNILTPVGKLKERYIACMYDLLCKSATFQASMIGAAHGMHRPKKIVSTKESTISTIQFG